MCTANDPELDANMYKQSSDTSDSKEGIDKAPKKGCWGKKYESGEQMGVWEESLEDRSGFVSRWLLSYLDPLLALGSHKVLEQSDIGVPSKSDEAEFAYSIARKAWEEQVAKCAKINTERQQQHEAKLAACTTEAQRKKVKEPKVEEPSISIALFAGFGRWTIARAMIYYVLSGLLTFVPVLILNSLVGFFESGQSISEYAEDNFHPWLQVAGLGFLPFLISLLQTRHFSIMAHCSVFARTAVSTLLYRKALRVSASGRAMTSTGQVVNMMSNDTSQLQRFLQFVGLTATAPIQIILALALIYREVRFRRGFSSHSIDPHDCTGWQCDMGRRWLYDFLGTREYGCVFDRVEAAAESVEVL